jgi:uncharacterized protein YukE
MVDKLAVYLDGLSTSAAKVQGHGDDLAISHTNTDTRMSAASGGWTGQSSVALTVWAAKLKTQSTALVDRMGSQSQHMHSAVDKYGTNEEQRAHDFANVHW